MTRQLALADLLPAAASEAVGNLQQARELRIVLPGEPVAQGRGKVGKWKSRDGREGTTVRDPAKSRNWKAFAMERFAQTLEAAGIEWPWALEDEPVELLVVAYFACPKSQQRKTSPRPERPKLSKPDFDNLAKIVGDAGNGVLWHDDAQIYDGRARKVIAAQGEPARVEILVRKAEASR